MKGTFQHLREITAKLLPVVSDVVAQLNSLFVAVTCVIDRDGALALFQLMFYLIAYIPFLTNILD